MTTHLKPLFQDAKCLLDGDSRPAQGTIETCLWCSNRIPVGGQHVPCAGIATVS